MVTKCIINTCNTIKAGDGVSLHRLPSNAQVQQEWFRAILHETGQTVFSEDDVICSKHFSSDCFVTVDGKVVLNPTAVPFESLKVDGPEPKRVKRDKDSKPRCCVFSCENSMATTENVRPQLAYHRFPKDPEIIEQWKQFCNNDVSSSESSYVCSDHFNEDDYVSKRGVGRTKTLKSDAVPTIYKRENTLDEQEEVGTLSSITLDSPKMSSGDGCTPVTVSVGSVDLGTDETLMLEDCSDQKVKGVESEMKTKTGILNGIYFKVLNRDIVSRKIEAQCMSCIPHLKVIRGCINVTTNFLKHLEKRHPEEYINYVKNKRRSAEQIASMPAKVAKIKQIEAGKWGCYSQNVYDQKLLLFLINTMTPIDIIEQPSFRSLFEDSAYDIMNKETALEKIHERYDLNVERIIKLLSDSSYVCTTVDIWTLKRQHFLGVTCHWIDADFKRQSVALSCKRFSGIQDQIPILLEDIYSKYKLDAKKIVSTVTDSGTNLLKYFQKYGIHTYIAEDLPEYSGDDDYGYIEENLLPNFVEILGEDRKQSSPSDTVSKKIHLALPSRIKCFTSTLNLIVTQDINNVIGENGFLSSRHKYVMSKCSELWKKAMKAKSAKLIENITGRSLSFPKPTNWISLYKAVKSILLIKNCVPTLYQLFNMKNPFMDADMEYLEEYIRVLAPFATLLELLEEEQNSFSGYVLPSLIALKVKFDKMKSSCTLKHATLLLNACIDLINEKFAPFFTLSSEINEAIIAAATLPMFKLRWLNGIKNEISLNLKDIQELIVKAAENEYNEKECDIQTSKLNSNSFSEEASDFFDFNESEVNAHSKTVNNSRLFAFELELLKYIDDKRTNLDMLNDYPEIKKLFFKYNTHNPSSASVERLFSFETMSALSTKTYFEQYVVLRANQKL